MPDNKFYAVTAKCPHNGVAVNPFKKGVGLLCPAHGSKFEANGKKVNGPARSSLKSYKATYNGSAAVSVEFPDLVCLSPCLFGLRGCSTKSTTSTAFSKAQCTFTPDNSFMSFSM